MPWPLIYPQTLNPLSPLNFFKTQAHPQDEAAAKEAPEPILVDYVSYEPCEPQFRVRVLGLKASGSGLRA